MGASTATSEMATRLALDPNISCNPNPIQGLEQELGVGAQLQPDGEQADM